MPQDETGEHTLLPVTALATRHGDGHILAGIGPDIHVHHARDATPLATRRPFGAAQAVHGICSDEHGTLAWGGRRIAISTAGRDGFRAAEAPDWILDAKLAGPGTAYAVTAHSVLLRVDFMGEGGAVAVSELTPPSRGLLMTAQIRLPATAATGTTTARMTTTATETGAAPLLVVTGSQFGEVAVWSFGEGGATRTHYIIRAHEGPVFGVDCEGGLLVSCSDDRTVKVWDVHGVLSLGLCDGGTAHGPVYLDTPVASGMRHESRVWRVRFLDQPGGSGDCRLLSAGEDATCRVWRLEHAAGGSELRQLTAHKDHDGKSIWSVAVQAHGDGHVDVITGGADGAVVRRRRAASALVEAGSTGTFALDLQGAPGWEDGDFVRAYDFLHHWALLMTTDRGHVYVCERREFGGAGMACIGTFEDIKRYSVVKSLIVQTVRGPEEYGFFAGNSGRIFVYSGARKQISVIAEVGGKVAGLFPHSVQPETPSTASTTIHLLATCLVPGQSRLFSLQAHSETPGVLETLSSFTVDVGRCTITSTILWTDRLILGTRDGSLGVCNAKNKGTMLVSGWKQCGSEAVTALHQLSRSDAGGWLAATSRDGALRLYEVRAREGDEWDLSLVHDLALPFGPNVEGIYSGAACQLWVYGFDKTDFVMYDVASEQRLIAVDCGGSHRHWACQVSSTPGFRAAFACTRAGAVYGHEAAAVEYEAIRPGGHGREIKACAVRPVLKGQGSSDSTVPVVATGAEDTNIRLWRGHTPVATLRRHVTGIQRLRWSEDGELLFSGGGVGELFVWRIRELPFTALQLGVVFESRCPLAEELLDLRVMDVDMTARAGGGEGIQVYLVSLGLSNSSIVHYRYEAGWATEPRWTLLSTSVYSSACITQVKHLCVQARPMVLTASTDGHLALWSAAGGGPGPSPQSGGSGSPDGVFDILRLDSMHQSSVTALDLQELIPGKYLVATGGDDNALGITLLSSSRDGEPGITLTRHRVPRAHAAAITAVAVLEGARSSDDDDDGEVTVTVVTSSNDQRIKTWRVTVGASSGAPCRVERMSDLPSPVADASDMASLPGGRAVLLCGVGMQTCTITPLR